MTPEQQVEFQRQLAIQATVQHDEFFAAGHPFPWAPPGKAFWSAILEARKAKRNLPKKHRGPPNKKAPKDQWEDVIDTTTGEVIKQVPPPAYMFVSADDYVEELDRACLPQGVVVCPSATVKTEGGPGGSRQLNTAYYVAHAETGEGMVFRADVPISGGSGMGDPTKKAYTDSLAMFCRGFLAIPRANAPEQEELVFQPQVPIQAQPPQPHPGHQGPPPGFAPAPFPQPQAQPPGPPAGRPYQQPFAPPQGMGPSGPAPPFQPPPRGGPGFQPPFAGGPGGPGPGAPQAHGPPPQWDGHPLGGRAGGPPHGMVAGQAGRQVPPPPMNGGIANDPTVQGAHAMLGQQSPPPGYGPEQFQQQPPPQGQQRQPPPQFPPASNEPDPDLTTPPAPPREVPIRGARPDEPQTMDQWFQALVDRGWDEEAAMQLATHRPDEPISQELKEAVINGEGLRYFGSAQAVRDAFNGTGYVPKPNLPENQKVMPTGLQLLRFAIQIDKSKVTS